MSLGEDLFAAKPKYLQESGSCEKETKRVKMFDRMLKIAPNFFS